MAAAEIRQPPAQTGDPGAVEATTVAADAAKARAAIHSPSRRPQSAGFPDPAAPVVERQPTITQKKGDSMKPTLRYQSQLLFRKSFKPNRTLRIRPAKVNFIFRPMRFGVKPKIIVYECK
jgi:hypothetical protein